MKLMTYRRDGEDLSIALHGSVDSANAAELERAIEEARAEGAAQRVTVDCEELKYISSAGLRVMLRLKKSAPALAVVNVSPEVYEIFDMTGFTEMMDIRKAYRVVSVDGCEVIGQGANGKVYRIAPDTIVKVYGNPDALPEIQHERELARTAFVLGVPTAIPYDVVRIAGGGYGSVFELLNAASLAKLLASGEKDVEETARMSVDLLRTIHGTVVKPDSMPDMKHIALGWADELNGAISMPALKKLRALIADVPDDPHMLHGDYHIKNVMVQDGECLLIDMDTLCHGHPIFELASMYNAYVGYAATDPDEVRDFLGIPYETAKALWERMLRLYLDGMDETHVRAVEEKAMIVGDARILRRARRIGDTALAAHCQTVLEELIPRVNELTF